MSQPVFNEMADPHEWMGFALYATGDWMHLDSITPDHDVWWDEMDDNADARAIGQVALAVTGCI